VPQVIDDPQFPARVLAGGHKIGWRLREQCIARILFESGGRVSEVVGQTLGDWVARGILQETQAFSKGSHGKRVKFLRFSAATAKLLRRYCDTERREIDLHHYALDDYLQAARSEKLDLYQAPLFLSRHKTPLAPKTFRDHYWNPACRAAGIEADVHQARHWYITQIVRKIHRPIQYDYISSPLPDHSTRSRTRQYGAVAVSVRDNYVPCGLRSAPYPNQGGRDRSPRQGYIELETSQANP